MKVQRQDVLQQNFMKIEFFVLSTRHQNCLDKSLEQNIWFIVYASFSAGGLNLLADLRGDLARKKRGELILQCTLWDCKFFENSKFLPIGAKFILNVVYKFTSRLFFQQFDRAEDFCMPKAVNTVSK